MSTPATILAIRVALSLPRIETYEHSIVAAGDIGSAAIDLYDWNAQISGAFMAPLHICEVVTRNAVSDALTAVYGDRWPWESAFETSLPAPRFGYNPRRDLVAARDGQLTTGKVLPELKFVFWQKMFTGRHDVRVWKPHLLRVMPNLDVSKTLDLLRSEIYANLEHVRFLRNRIAHHEPIFRRNFAEDLDKIAALIRSRCHHIADWMLQNQRVTSHFRSP